MLFPNNIHASIEQVTLGFGDTINNQFAPIGPHWPLQAGADYPNYTCVPSVFQYPYPLLTTSPHFYNLFSLYVTHTHTLLLYTKGMAGAGALLK